MISIVIPTLNERSQIGNLLDSIVTQKCEEPIEVVVADAHSTDGTREFVEQYRDRIAIKIVDGGKPPVARNRGARASAGDLILFTDADVTFPSASFLARSAKYVRERGIGIAAAELRAKSDRIGDHAIFGIGNSVLRIMSWIRPIGSLCLLVTRETFNKTGGYPEDRLLCEEHDFVGNALPFSRYGILPERVVVSVRRFNKEGRLGSLWKYFYASFYRALFGPITKPIFTYEFKYTDAENT